MMNRLPGKALFYDRHTSGHHTEYLRYLVGYIREHKLENIHLAVPAAGLEVLGSESESMPIFHLIPALTAANLLQQTREEGKWIAELVKEQGFGELFFLNFDPYQYVVGTPLFCRLNCRIHGILFSPPHRMYPAAGSPWKDRLSLYARRERKYLQLRWAMRNKRLKNLLILDDEDGARQLDKLGHTNFSALNDPIDQAYLSSAQNVNYEVLPEGKLLVAFGSIIARKNLENIIRSLKMCGEKRITLLIVGKGQSDYIDALRSLAAEHTDGLATRVIIDDRFVSDDEMEKLFAVADALVMVYLNFYGSSGVLGRAAKYGKPVLVANEGLVGVLARQYQLGVGVNPDPASIATGIKQVLASDASRAEGQLAYLRPKTVQNFCLTIMDTIYPQAGTK